MANLLDVRDAIELKGQISFTELARQLKINDGLLEGILFHLEQRGLIEKHSLQAASPCGAGKCQNCTQRQQPCAPASILYRIKSH